jgi:hypothetical protein
VNDGRVVNRGRIVNRGVVRKAKGYWPEARGLSEADGEGEGASFLNFAVDRYRRAHCRYDAFADGESDSGASEFTGCGAVELGELVEDLPLPIRADSDSCIRNAERARYVVVWLFYKLCGNDNASRFGEFYGIGDQVE